MRTFLIFLLCTTTAFSEHIGVIGAGYVGLVLTGILGECNHSVECIDIDKDKIELLKNAKMPIYEPGLQDFLFHSPFSSDLVFSSDFNALLHCPIIYLCVETPRDSQGRCNSNAIYHLLDQITTSLPGPRLICVKSTIAPGLLRQFKTFIQSRNRSDIELVYNPEFLREGSALSDILERNPLVLGSDSKEAMELIENLFIPLLTKNPDLKIIKTTPETAELIKYSWNGFSALRITYINELSHLCREFSADIFTVIQGMALSEALLPTDQIRPGPGYGGSCLPKDTSCLAKCFEDHGRNPTLIHQTILSNEQHQHSLVQSILNLLKEEPRGKTVALLGLAFKAKTDDIRHSPALLVIQALSNLGVDIQAYDPLANQKVKALYPHIDIFDSPYEATKEADCVVILSDALEIQELSLEKLTPCLKQKKLIDTRNVFDPQKLKGLGYEYANAGRL